MRSVLFSATSLGSTLGILLSWSAIWAVPGEKHYVGSGFALVREAPHGAAATVATIPAGQAVVEIAIEGNWLQVGVVGRGITGWIHLSFLVAGRGADRRSVPLIPPMRRFRRAFDTFNAMKGAENNGPPFTSVSDRGDGVLLVTASVEWWANPSARKQDDLTSLHQMWKVANEQLPVAVFVSDPQGQRQLKRTDAPAVQPPSKRPSKRGQEP